MNTHRDRDRQTELILHYFACVYICIWKKKWIEWFQRRARTKNFRRCIREPYTIHKCLSMVFFYLLSFHSACKLKYRYRDIYELANDDSNTWTHHFVTRNELNGCPLKPANYEYTENFVKFFKS